MNWQRKDSEPKKDGESAPGKNTLSPLDGAVAFMPAQVTRKPSERFTRRSLEAKSRASQSERFKLASLKEKLNSKGSETTNEATVFNGYCPGREKLPG